MAGDIRPRAVFCGLKDLKALKVLEAARLGRAGRVLGSPWEMGQRWTRLSGLLVQSPASTCTKSGTNFCSARRITA